MKNTKRFVVLLLAAGTFFLWGGMTYARVSAGPVRYRSIGIALCGLLSILIAVLLYESDFHE